VYSTVTFWKLTEQRVLLYWTVSTIFLPKHTTT